MELSVPPNDHKEPMEKKAKVETEWMRSEGERLGRELEEVEAEMQRASEVLDQQRVTLRPYGYESDEDTAEQISLMALIREYEEQQQQRRIQSTMLQFEMECLSLRQNRGMEFGPTLTADAREQLPRGYAKPFGEALLGNTAVTAIPLSVSWMLPVADHSDPLAASAYIEPLVRHVRTSTAVRQVLLWEWHMLDDVNNVVVRTFLEAVVENPSIVVFDYRGRIPAAMFGTLFCNAKHIKTLRVNFFISGYSTERECADVANGFRQMASTLESLTLEGIEDNHDLAIPILKCLNKKDSVLKELKLCGSSETPPEYWQALAEFLQSTTVLEHLELDRFSFSAENMSSFLAGLHLPDQSGPLPQTISKLTFGQCTFAEDALHAWTTFMNTRTTRADGTEAQSSLRQLVFDVESEDSFDGYDVGPAIAEMLLQDEEDKVYPTIGSHIHTLSLTRFSTACTGFLLPLFREPHRVSLRRLLLCQVDDGDCLGLTRCLSVVTSIQALHLEHVSNPRQSANILMELIRESGSLCSFTDGDLGLFSWEQSRRIKAYCLRNQFLMKNFGLQSKAGLKDKDSDRFEYPFNIKSNVEWNGNATLTHHTSDMLLYPNLFQLSKPIATHRSQTMLSGLLKLGESIASIE